ncbi:MAG: hypothetical protein INR71_02365, partial [Terriglobus roseus]|nr:hypothetical protein [Terriglobus roseus]
MSSDGADTGAGEKEKREDVAADVVVGKEKIEEEGAAGREKSDGADDAAVAGENAGAAVAGPGANRIGAFGVQVWLLPEAEV